MDVAEARPAMPNISGKCEEEKKGETERQPPHLTAMTTSKPLR